MKKKINKLQLKKTVITILNNQSSKQREELLPSKPIVTCRVACAVSTGCPG